MHQKARILFVVEAMGGGVFTYIVDLANELVKNMICILLMPSGRRLLQIIRIISIRESI